ncbi:PREDICTED: uncharacterized protein LOC109187732 [Ipomoea nil]|uniref:uncharacterized protein LOC109187732 n=1 Tax=Ipomoea nil TaxID=35883 RepID=UPI00090112FC|nr:PREDICTED: uncharacterized protein LOC109187732 [Ipomoea nil]XP_019193576.1 PREDICTED: uncharacterized protein LOC109187732 [Ipomoea nil]
MGDVLSKAADGVGNALAAPLKAMLGGSCEDVCSGVWDITCFITHLCVSDLMRLFMILILCYITLLFFYLFFKLGVCQCVGKTVCKMYCSACKAYCSALGCMACFFWHKLTNVKRVNRRRRRRRRFPDVETSDSSTSGGGGSDRDASVSRKRKVITKEMESSRHHNHHSRHRHRHHHRRMNGRQFGVEVKGRPLKLKKLRHHRRHHHHPRKNTVALGTETASFKRRRLV